MRHFLTMCLTATLLAVSAAPALCSGSALDGRRLRAELEQLALRLLRQATVRMLVIDELHNVLAGRGDTRREFLPRSLGNELKIPLVGVGTHGGDGGRHERHTDQALVQLMLGPRLWQERKQQEHGQGRHPDGQAQHPPAEFLQHHPADGLHGQPADAGGRAPQRHSAAGLLFADTCQEQPEGGRSSIAPAERRRQQVLALFRQDPNHP
ncbi:hypothetical protein GCM10009733_032640 [Nonomuraea maheshkhaliensis]|uniref:ATP-binding protein n=2 Tax=Nonomuraea maheshkhaliensis TaxID=419590 RepID=A0ABN2F880_9ACTN